MTGSRCATRARARVCESTEVNTFTFLIETLSKPRAAPEMATREWAAASGAHLKKSQARVGHPKKARPKERPERVQRVLSSKHHPPAVYKFNNRVRRNTHPTLAGL